MMRIADCANFNEYMKEIYVDHTHKIKVVDPLGYLCLNELEFRTLYRKNKWSAVKHNPSFVFFRDSDGGKGGYTDNQNQDQDGS